MEIGRRVSGIRAFSSNWLIFFPFFLFFFWLDDKRDQRKEPVPALWNRILLVGGSNRLDYGIVRIVVCSMKGDSDIRDQCASFFFFFAIYASLFSVIILLVLYLNLENNSYSLSDKRTKKIWKRFIFDTWSYRVVSSYRFLFFFFYFFFIFLTRRIYFYDGELRTRFRRLFF